MAVPNPERELKRLEQKAKAGLDRVTIITGASTFFRGEALEFVLAAVPKGRDLRSIDGQQDTTDGRELQLLRYKPAGRAASLDYLARRLTPAQCDALGETLRSLSPTLGDGFSVRVD